MKTTKKILPFLFTAMILLASACSQSESAPKGNYQKISAEEAKQKMTHNPTAILLDVRTQEEFEEKHIAGAILVPNETITTDQQPELLPDLDAEILIYCRSGNRSQQASEKLIALGYTNVYDFGGIDSWSYETVSGK